MSDLPLRSFAGCLAVICILGMVFLVESRPPADDDEAMPKFNSEREFREDGTPPEVNRKRLIGHSRTDLIRDKRSPGVRHIRDEPANVTTGSEGTVIPNDEPTTAASILGTKTEVSQVTFSPDLKNFKACAGGKGFCEEIDNYPEEQLDTLLMSESNRTLLQAYLGKDKLVDTVIKNKYDEPSEVTLCLSVETYIKPIAGETEKGKPPVMIVNHPNNTKWQQILRVEYCSNEGGPCALTDYFPAMYRATCKQKYVYWRVLAVKPSGEFYPESFLFPSHCVCTVTLNEGQHADRMGNPMTPNPNTAKQGKP